MELIEINPTFPILLIFVGLGLVGIAIRGQDTPIWGFPIFASTDSSRIFVAFSGLLLVLSGFFLGIRSLNLAFSNSEPVATEISATPPTDTAVPTPTSVPPTNIPVPTRTPISPTDMPVPTDTSVPPIDTAIPTPTRIRRTSTSSPSTNTPVPPTPSSVVDCPEPSRLSNMSPSISLYYVKFAVNGIEQTIVWNKIETSLEVTVGDVIEVKEIATCLVKSLDSEYGTTTISFTRVDVNGTEFETIETDGMMINNGLILIEGIHGKTGQNIVWNVQEQWESISINVIHYKGDEWEHDDYGKLNLVKAFVPQTDTPTPTSDVSHPKERVSIGTGVFSSVQISDGKYPLTDTQTQRLYIELSNLGTHPNGCFVSNFNADIDQIWVGTANPAKLLKNGEIVGEVTDLSSVNSIHGYLIDLPVEKEDKLCWNPVPPNGFHINIGVKDHLTKHFDSYCYRDYC